MTVPLFRKNAPQPLPLLLMMAAGQQIFWRHALKNAKDVSTFLKPLFTDSLSKVKNPPEFEDLYSFLTDDAYTQATQFWRGVKRYQTYKSVLKPSKATALWSRLSSTLWDYGGNGKKPFFIIPSLINKSSIMDLHPKHSFISALKKQGLRPLILDWGSPAEAETNMAFPDYMDYILRPALSEVNHAFGKPDIMGYCMGGIMAMQLSTMMPDDIKKMILLATPINFKALGMSYPETILRRFSASVNAHQGLISADVTPALFWLKDPFLTIKKYQKFETLQDAQADYFVAIEDWLNDTVPLSKWIAEEAINSWYIDNNLVKNKGRFDLTKIKTPTLMITPTRDSVVPKTSTEILKDFIKVTQMSPQTGHVGVVSDPKVQAEFVPKMMKWLED